MLSGDRAGLPETGTARRSASRHRFEDGRQAASEAQTLTASTPCDDGNNSKPAHPAPSHVEVTPCKRSA